MANQLQVTSIRERKDFAPNGSIIDVYEISFITAKGASAFHRVPVADYDAVKTREEVEKKAASLDALLG